MSVVTPLDQDCVPATQDTEWDRHQNHAKVKHVSLKIYITDSIKNNNENLHAKKYALYLNERN